MSRIFQYILLFIILCTSLSEALAVSPKGRVSGLPFSKSRIEQIDSSNFPDMIKSFDYPNAEIKDIIKAIGHLTGINFIVDPNVKGKISIVAPSPITVAEAFQAFLSALSIHGYALVRSGAFWKIIPASQAASDNVQVYQGAYFPDSDQYITKVFKLKHTSVTELEKHLKLFLSGGSKKRGGGTTKMVISEDTNSIIVTDYGSAIDKLSQIIKILDVPSQNNLLEVIAIEHAEALDLATKVALLLSKKGRSLRTSRSSRSSRSSSSTVIRPSGSDTGISAIVPDERTNTIVVAGSRQGIDKVKKLIKKLDFFIDPTTAGGIYVYYVKHGTAKDLEVTLNKILNPKTSTNKKTQQRARSFQLSRLFNYSGLQNNISIASDNNTNSLLVTASRKDFSVLKSVLSRIDIPKNQVFIKTIIMDFNANNNLDWKVSAFHLLEGAAGAILPRIGFSSHSLQEILNPSKLGAGASLPFGFGDLHSIPASLFNIGGNKDKDKDKDDPDAKATAKVLPLQLPSTLGLVELLKKRAGGNIISTPQIIAIDNETSSITVGVNTPVSKTTSFGGVNNSVAQTSVDRQDVETKLEITPYINPDGRSVRLKILQKIDSINATVSTPFADAVSVTKREIKTNVILNDGGTAILGGLISNQEEKTVSKIPFFGDLPIVGWLFRSSNTTKERKNLIVFITPRIIKTPLDHEPLVKDMIDKRIDFIKKFTGNEISNSFKNPLPELVTEKPLSAGVPLKKPEKSKSLTKRRKKINRTSDLFN